MHWHRNSKRQVSPLATRDDRDAVQGRKRLSKIERAVELRGLGLPQAEIDEKQASAVSALINAIGSIPSAAIQSGSILLLKLTVDGQATIQVRTLSQREMIVLENHQDCLIRRRIFLESLQNFVKLVEAPTEESVL
jgi:hypothetical protein